MSVILNDEDLARKLQDDYYYSLETEDWPQNENPHEKATSDAESKKSNGLLQGIWSIMFSKAEVVVDDPSFTPEIYSDCKSEKEKIRWLNSVKGQTILSRRPILNEYYKNGKIFQMIKNKHWDVRLNEWLTEYPNETKIPFGTTLPMNKIVREQMKNRWIHKPHVFASLDTLFPDHSYTQPVHFPTQNKYEILIDGFTIFPNIIPLHIIDAAQAAINNAIVNSESFIEASKNIENKNNFKNIGDAKPLNEDPNFTSGVTNDKNVLALFYQSPVYALVEALLHNITPDTVDTESHTGNSEYPTKQSSHKQTNFHNYTHGAQIAYRFSESRRIHHSGGGTKLGGLGWHIDGMERGTYGSFSLLIGFPLNDQLSDFSGNLCLHAGSHHILNNPYVKTYAQQCELINKDKDPSEQQIIHVPKPKLDEPVQVKVGRGDVVFVLHKVGHRGGPNYSDNVRKMVYFRVSHRDHNKNKFNSFDNIWLDYEGMEEVL